VVTAQMHLGILAYLLIYSPAQNTAVSSLARAAIDLRQTQAFPDGLAPPAAAAAAAGTNSSSSSGQQQQ